MIKKILCFCGSGLGTSFVIDYFTLRDPGLSFAQTH